MNLLIKTNILLSIFINLVHSNPTEKSNQTKLVEELEKEKKNLFHQINEAIDESVKSFKTTNDSDTLMKIQQMELLKERVRDLNEYKIQVKRRQGENDTGVTQSRDIEGDKQTANDQFENRSVLLSSKETEEDDKRKHVKKNLREGLAILAINMHDSETQKQYKKGIKEERRDENRILVQKNLEKWMQIKALEKIRKKEEKIRLKKLDTEKCPRFGLKKKGKKFPCCRKCCKKSYMGCL